MEIPIKEWNSFNPSNPHPFLYIPSEYALILKDKSHFTIEIKGTGSCYDDIIDTAVVLNSGEILGNRPNFEHHSQFTAVAPTNLRWQGYPPREGYIILHDFIENREDEEIEKNENTLSTLKTSNNSNILNKTSRFGISYTTFGFFSLLAIALILNNLKNRNFNHKQ